MNCVVNEKQFRNQRKKNNCLSFAASLTCKSMKDMFKFCVYVVYGWVDIYIIGCPNLTVPAFGTMNASQGFGAGANVYFTCDPYTVMNGPSVRTCQTNNTWSENKDPVCGQYINVNYL